MAWCSTQLQTQARSLERLLSKQDSLLIHKLLLAPALLQLKGLQALMKEALTPMSIQLSTQVQHLRLRMLPATCQVQHRTSSRTKLRPNQSSQLHRLMHRQQRAHMLLRAAWRPLPAPPVLPSQLLGAGTVS